ncbi:MAG: UvrD-helicase domain-containing protein [Clostridiaceae bacterium]
MSDILKEELERAIQLELEKEHLGDVLIELNDDLLKGIKYRKNIAEMILKNRENNLEEYKEDKDKIAEYFDHENFIKEEAYKAIDKRLKELIYLINSPYFGRIDFKEEDEDELESIYIGRYGFISEEKTEPTIIDWRAPVSSLFYDDKMGESHYRAPLGDIPVNVSLKRQFMIKKGELNGMFDSSVDIKDEILQMVLSQNSEEKLKDIVTTIQKEQDDIIREKKNITVVVNGVAGSGKTTIALHRVAYLLYNYRDTLKGRVLILGPNSVFIDYIKEVLPSLGEEGIPQTTFQDLAMEFIGLNNIMPYREYMEKILEKDIDFIQKIIRKTSEEYIFELDNLVSMQEEKYKFEDIYLLDNLVIEKKELNDLFSNYYKNMPLFKRLGKIKRIVYRKIKDVRDILISNINKEYEELCIKQKDKDKNNLLFMRKLKIRELMGNIIELKKGLIVLKKGNVIDIYNNFNRNEELTIDDLAPILYLKIKLEEAKLKNDIKHIVIDEAQDYSPLQFIVLKELTKVSSFTIVGDYDQRITPLKGSVSMLNLDQHLTLEIVKYNLNKSYRSTKEIMEYARKYTKSKEILPLVRSGDPVEEIFVSDENEMLKMIDEKIDILISSGYESISVIVRDIKEAKFIYEYLKKDISVSLIDTEDKILRKGVSIITSYFAKGLEFDAVVIPKMGEIEDNLLYIMCTRALHKLIIINKK